MFVQKLMRFARNLENPKNPLLGPSLRGLYWFGLWQYGNKLHNSLFKVVHVCASLFVITQFIELYQSRADMKQVLENISVTGISMVTICKTISFISMQTKWTEIVDMISKEEISAMEKRDPDTINIMGKYTKYSRLITYTYWILLLLTNFITIMLPALKYVFTAEYRQDIRDGIVPYPYIIRSWFPFNKDKVPGYFVVTFIHVWMTCQGAGIVAVYDAHVVVVMAFLRGQAMIIQGKCRGIFGGDKTISAEEIVSRVKECHRHHNFLLELYDRLNVVLSPVMFIYLLVCSITMCCAVVQFTIEDVTFSEKLWITEIVAAQAFELFLFCWHSNEIALETAAIGQGVFESKYWRSTLRERKLLTLLAGKAEKAFVLNAGPFTNLSVPTFVDVIKGTYSFYALVAQMQESK